MAAKTVRSTVPFPAVRELIARKSYAKAIDILKVALRQRRGDERLRVQLADVLALAGRNSEAAELLNALADDLALSGQAGKAITALKKAQRLLPGRDDIDEKLSYLIKHQSRPSFDPWSHSKEKIDRAPSPYEGAAPARQQPVFGMEEFSDETAEPPTAEAVKAAMASPPAPNAAQAESVASAPQPRVDELFAGPDALDQLAAMVDDVFTTAEPAPPSSDKLSESPLFRNFSQEELVAVIRGLRLHTFEAGEIIVSAGEPGDSLYILTTGSVRAYMRDKRGKHIQVREMHEGDFFGEMSVLTGNLRSATITASTECELLELDQQTLNQICTSHVNVRTVLQDFYKLRARHTLEEAIQGQAG